jgi:hypothetical protein
MGETVVHGLEPLSCLIDLPYITHPQAAKQAANFPQFCLVNRPLYSNQILIIRNFIDRDKLTKETENRFLDSCS